MSIHYRLFGDVKEHVIIVSEIIIFIPFAPLNINLLYLGMVRPPSFGWEGIGLGKGKIPRGAGG